MEALISMIFLIGMDNIWLIVIVPKSWLHRKRFITKFVDFKGNSVALLKSNFFTIEKLGDPIKIWKLKSVSFQQNEI